MTKPQIGKTNWRREIYRARRANRKIKEALALLVAGGRTMDPVRFGQIIGEAGLALAENWDALQELEEIGQEGRKK